MQGENETMPIQLPKLYTGMHVEVLTPANRLIFVGQVEVLDHDTLQITEEQEGTVPWVEYNTQIKLRGFQQGGTPFSLYGKICGSTKKFWRVDRLQSLQHTEKRKFYRQTITLQGMVISVDPIFSDSSRNTEQETIPQEVPCTVLDISGGGVRLRCAKSAKFELDSWLFLVMEDPLKEGHHIGYTCHVQRVSEVRGSWEYGCEFDGLTEAEQEQLLQFIMALQQRELRARRARERY